MKLKLLTRSILPHINLSACRRLLLIGAVCHSGFPPLHATTYYWDSNGTTSGLGNTGSLIWGTSANWAALNAPNSRSTIPGTLAVANTTIAATDTVFFGTVGLALGSTASTIGIVGTGVTANTIVFNSGQTNPVTLSGGGGSITLASTTPTVAVNNASDIIAAVLAGTAGMTKGGPGALTLTGANTYTGTTIVSGGGILNVGNGTTGNLNNGTPSALTFSAGGGLFNVAQAAGVSQSMGALTFSAGEGTVQSTYPGSGNSVLAFSSLAARTAGASGNFVISGGTNGTTEKIAITGAPTGTLLDKGLFFGGANYAACDAGGYVRALNYATSGGDANTVDADIITASKHVKLTASPASRAGDTLLSLNLSGSGVDYTMSSGSLTVPAILKSGGGSVSTISGGTSVTTAGNAELVIRTDAVSDLLAVSSAVTGFSGGLTKSGVGTLTLSGSNAYTGATTVNAGTLAVSGGGAIADAGAVVLANAAGATLRLDGNETIGNLSGGGLSGGTVNVQGNTLTLSDNTSTTFGGNFTGSGGLIKSGTGTLTLSRPNSFPGAITLNGGTLLFTYGNDGSSSTPAMSSGGAINMANNTGITFQPLPGVTLGVSDGNNPSQLSSAGSAWIISNPINITSGTATFRFYQNGNHWTFNGGVTGGTSGSQTLKILQGTPGGGGGDAQIILFSGVIQNGAGGTLGVSIDFTGASGTGQSAFVNLPAPNTFTGPLSVANTRGLTNGGYVTIGGERTSTGASTLGTGSLAGGNYSGNISLVSGTILDFATSANQTLGGVISGSGGNILKEGAGTLTLTGANTYTGDITVSAGTLVLANGATMGFAVTDAASNKLTGAGTATINGTFNINTSAVTVTSGEWTLVNVTNKTYGGSFGLTGFSGPVGNVYTKTTGNQFWSFDKSTGKLTLSPVLNTGCTMLICDFGALGQATITEAAGTAVLTVPPNQQVTALAPTFALSTNATISPASGSTQNFTNPVVYRVTAQDGVTFKDYTVTVESYATWAHVGSMFILTTPSGANIPAGVTVNDFPLLVRLNSSNFNFAEAQSDGRDIRFTTPSGAPLSYQIEQWDSVNGSAAIWVRMPAITGNSTQEIKIYWGKSGVGTMSSGASVFNASNGYASVIHLGDTLTDETGGTTPTNSSTTAGNGLIGRGRTFAFGQGIQCGTSLSSLPTGAGPFSTGVWIRPLAFGTSILGWGQNTPSQGTVKMQLDSPPRINMDCWFGGAGVSGAAGIPASQWTYVVHTFQTTGTRLYVNGALDASNNGGSMNLPTSGRYDIGGWAGTNNFVGDIDEVRISKVVRSADWVKLEYENQKPVQTLVGGIVSGGSDFSVSPTTLTMNEGSTTPLTAQAGGAQKVYWIYKKNGQETVIGTDQLTFNYTAPRVTADDSAIIQFKAVFPGGTQTIDVPLTVLNSAPDPAFTLVPSTTTWDGRSTMTVTANVTNLAAMQAAGFASLNYKWSVGGVAVTKQANNDILTLTRSQGSGPMTVTLTMDNGGAPVTRNITINVTEPASDPWVERTPGATEKAVSGQFFARNPNTNLGTVFYNGTQGGSPDTVYLKVYKTPSGGAETLHATHRQSLVSGAYAFSAPINAGLFTYRIVYGTTTGGVDTDVATVTDLVCGDAFIIEGQSNALALNNTAPEDNTTSKWIRTYSLSAGWGYAVKKSGTSPYSNYPIGVWGWYLANRLLANNNMPVCFINAAVGGTRIDQHRPNPAGHGTAGSLYSIYANLYNRVVGAGLTHGIRALLWHQGEQDQGAEGPDGDYDYKFYQQYFVDISAAWKGDFPNIRNYYVFQIWPGACGDTSRNDQLREVQRTLPNLYSNMRIMSTLGIVPGSSCHYDEAGYAVFSDLIGPMVEQDVYGITPSGTITAPNLQKAYFTTSARNEIALEFGQPMAWNPGAPTMLFLADANGATAGTVSSGSATGNTIKLQVTGAASASTITYVKGTSWGSMQVNLLYGANAIAALTFADVAVGPAPPAGLSATGGTGQVSLAWTAATGATTYNVKRSTNGGGPYTTIATTTDPAYNDLSVTAGAPYYYVVSAVNTAGMSSSEGLDSNEASAAAQGGYAAWAANPAQGLTAGVNDGPLMDPDFDGMKNLLEFVLGTPPMVPSVSSLPTLKQDAGQWVFEYDRNDDSLPPATTQMVQYGSDLSGWSEIAIPAASSGGVTVTPGSPADHVRVVIPNIGGKVFARLKVSQ